MEYQTIVNPNGTISIVPVTQPQGIMVPAYETSQLDLVDQINQGSKNIDVPMTLEETMAGSVLPFDPRRFQSIFPPQATGIMKQVPLDMNRFQNVSDMSIIDETTNDEQSQEYIDEIKKSQGGGIAKLFELISSFTPFGLAKRGIESLKGFNDRLRNTDFAKSKTLADYFDARKYGGRDERDAASARNMAQARGIQKKIDTGEYRRTAADDVIDRGRGENNIPTTRSQNVARTASRVSDGKTRAYGL
jgi:hypothetical protein